LVLVRVEARVRLAERVARGAGVFGQEDGPERGADLEPLALGREGLARGVEDLLDRDVADRGEQAELVAAEAERGSAFVRDSREPDPEALEQRIAGRVAEGVV